MINTSFGQYANGNRKPLQSQNVNGNQDKETKVLFSHFMQQKSVVRGEDMASVLSNGKRAPYEHLANSKGYIEYNGVQFFCDSGKEQLCLGDMSKEEDLLYISMEKGGCLRVNRNSIGDLSRAIGMFSPKDRNSILNAIAQDAKCQKMLQEMEEDKNTIVEEKTEDTKQDEK